MLADAKALGLPILEFMQKGVIDELRELYPDCVKESDKYLPAVLTSIYKKTNTQFVVITDEWDCYFREEKDNKQLIDDYLNFLRAMYKGSEADLVIKLAYMTGILPIKQYDVQSAMNNFTEFTMLKPGRLTEFIGFTEEEVIALCQQYEMDFDEMKRWYNGYSYKRVKSIYTPNSVVLSILNDEFGNYWTKTGTYDSIKDPINLNLNGLRDDIIALLGGRRIPVNILSFKNELTKLTNKNDVYTLLIHLGYLAYDTVRKEVYIPNKEIAEEFSTAVETSPKWGNIAEVLRRSQILVEETINGNAEMVVEVLELAHEDETSVLAYNNEESLACAITIAYYAARADYYMIRELPTGKGFADLALVPSKYCDKPAMLIELKYDKDADSGIRQIKEKRYDGNLKGYYDRLILVSINYDKETKKHSCMIENY